jgi:hypothetical protein
LFYEDDYKDIPYEISNIFLTTIKVDLPWVKNTPYYQEQKLWMPC